MILVYTEKIRTCSASAPPQKAQGGTQGPVTPAAAICTWRSPRSSLGAAGEADASIRLQLHHGSAAEPLATAGNQVVPWSSAKLSSLKSPAGKVDYVPPARYHLPPGFLHPPIHCCAINGKWAASGMFSLPLTTSMGGQSPSGPVMPCMASSSAAGLPALCHHPARQELTQGSARETPRLSYSPPPHTPAVPGGETARWGDRCAAEVPQLCRGLHVARNSTSRWEGTPFSPINRSHKDHTTPTAMAKPHP